MIVFLWIVGLIMSRFYVWPLWHKKELLLTQTVSLKKQLTRQHNDLKNHQAEKKQMEMLQAQLFNYPISSGNADQISISFAQKIMSITKQGEALLALLSKKYQLNLSSSSHLVVQVHNLDSDLTEAELSIELQGSKKKLLQWLQKIADRNDAITLQGFTWLGPALGTTVDDQNVPSIQLMYHLYYDNKHRLFAAKRTSNIRFFDNSSLYPTAVNVLANYSLKSIKMLGFIQSEPSDQQWALIQLPGGVVHKIKLGDELGLEHATVILIDEKKILLRSKQEKKTISLQNKEKDFYHENIDVP